jgi:hypothetical protein
MDMLLMDTHRIELVSNWSGLNHEGPLRTFEMPAHLPRPWIGGPVLAFFPALLVSRPWLTDRNGENCGVRFRSHRPRSALRRTLDESRRFRHTLDASLPLPLIISSEMRVKPMFQRENRMVQLLYRFLVGGLIVSLFAALADVLKPKSFAGLFGAAPSVGLATLALTVVTDGKSYASTEARSMAAAAMAFLAYACVTSRLMMRFRWRALRASVSALALWFAISFGLWFAFLR